MELWCSECEAFSSFEIETFTDPADILCAQGHIITTLKTEDPGVYQIVKIEE